MAVLLQRLICLVVVVAAVVHECQGISVAEDITLTAKQREILDTFKANVIPQLKHDYQHSDIYLIRWLRAKDFNLRDAEQLLREDIQWRKENSVDHILNEDRLDADELFPYGFGGFDKEGRPVITVELTDWDFRKSILAGTQEELHRQFIRMFEHCSTTVRKLQADGKNVTRCVLVTSVKNFNIAQHACFQCISVYPRLIGTFENHYPGMLDQFFTVDVPAGFEIILSVLRPAMSPATRKIHKVFGTNRKEWVAALLKDIDRDQLSKKFGGIASD